MFHQGDSQSPTVLIKFSLLQPERKLVRMQAAEVNRHLTAITAQSRTGETNTVNIYFTLKFRCTQDVFFFLNLSALSRSEILKKETKKVQNK